MIKKIQNNLLILSYLMKEFVLLIFISVLIFLVMHNFDHKNNQFLLASFIIIFSVVKVFIVISRTLKKMESLTNNNHKLSHIMFFSILIIFCINISFTFDYLCISEIYIDSFKGLNLNQSFLLKFFDLFYFSTVTYTTVGYGDIIPFEKSVKILTMLEMATSFITIVFILSRYNSNGK